MYSIKPSLTYGIMYYIYDHTHTLLLPQVSGMFRKLLAVLGAPVEIAVLPTTAEGVEREAAGTGMRKSGESVRLGISQRKVHPRTLNVEDGLSPECNATQ